MKSLFVTSKDGTRIAYDVTGHGQHLILLHGAGKTRRDWHKTGYVQRLQNDFTVITVDIRGTGESDKRFDARDYDIENICADLTLVADACHTDQFSVWGFSFGGNVARYLGAQSNRVQALAIIGVAPFGPAVDEKFGRYIAEIETKWGDAVRDYNRGKLSGKEREEICKRQLAVWLPCFQAMRSWSSIVPSDIHCPTMVLYGTKNDAMLNWVNANRELVEKSGIHIEICDGLNHNQEFTEINSVLPTVSAFFKNLV